MKKLQVFISYCHEDEIFRKELEKWLVELQQQELIDVWNDRRLIAGDPLTKNIFQKMNESHVILLLLSQDYLASQACRDEMSYALSVSQKKRVVSIIVKDCTWLETGCKELLALPEDGKAIINWQSSEKAWHSIYKGMKTVIEKLQHQFDINEEFLAEIQHFEFITQSKKEVVLEDVFVFPSLTIDKEVFKNETIDEHFFLEKKKKAYIIRGRQFSGKTTLLKHLFMKLRENYSPILLNGNNIHKTLNFDGHFRREFSRQFNGDFEAWMGLENKVVLIDNYNHNVSENIIQYLNDNFVMSILAVDDEEFMLYFMDEPVFSNYTSVTMSQFDFAQQEELIRKWRKVGQPNDLELDDLIIDKLEDRVNNVITTQRIVPRYPFYILSILQSLESFMPSDYHITAFGHCYQALVTAQLVKKNIKPEDLDTCFNYLKHLSYDIYDKTKKGENYAESEYKHFREQYKSRYIIAPALINKIENDDYTILDLRADNVKFEHSYIYFFFLGMHLASSDNETIINELCENIHLKENAFVLIFTIHHTQNKALLDTIRLHCVYSFEQTTPASLSSEETKFMNDLIATLPQSIISTKSTEKNRTEQRKRKSDSQVKETENNSEKNEVDEVESNDDVSAIEINKGIKIMEVLGQILKNRAGSFEIRDVEEILENTVDLGLRILKLFLDECKTAEFKEWLAKSLEDAEKEMSDTGRKAFDKNQRISYIERAIQVFGYVVTVGMLDRISEAVSTEKLIEVLDSLSERKTTPAYELVNHLVSSSQGGMNVSRVNSLLAKYDKTKNYWAKNALSYYAQIYLNTHNVNYQDRQRLFEALNLKYLPNKNK